MANEKFNTDATIDQVISRVNDAFLWDIVKTSPAPAPVPADKATLFMVWCPVDGDGSHFKLALVSDHEVLNLYEDLKTYAQVVEIPEAVSPIFCMYIKTREEHTAQEVYDYIDLFSSARLLKLGRVDVMTV